MAGDARAQSSAPAPAPASALHGQVHDRGVRVLQAESAAPAPTPAPVAVTAAPVVQPPARPVVAPVVPVAVIHDCPRPLGRTDLRLTAGADAKALAGTLRGGRRVAVDLVQPYSSRSGPPAALGPWFDAVRASGGHVTIAQYCTATRGLGTWLAHLFGGGTPAPKPDAFAAARNYDVVLHANSMDETVTQVEFVPRAKTGA